MAERVSNGQTEVPPLATEQSFEIDQRLDLRDLLLERGSSGLRRAGGFVREDFLPELIGQRGIQLYKEMRDNSSVIGAGLFAIETRIRNARWYVKPVAETAEAQEYAAILHGMLFEDLAMPWSLMLSEILSFLPFGFAYFEMIFKRRQGLQPPPLADGTPAQPSKYDDGYIGLAKIAPRSQDTVLRWQFDNVGALMGMHQLDPWTGRHAYLPYEKCLLFRPTSYKDNPEGRSILRAAYRAYYMVKHIENYEGIGIERDYAGMPLIYGPPQWFAAGASVEELAQLEQLKRMGRNVRNDEQACIVLPAIFDPTGNRLLSFELASSGGSKAFDTSVVIERYELRMTQSMLADLLFLGHEEVGSFALASSKATTEAMSLGGYMQVILDEFNRRCIPLLWRLNGFPSKFQPFLAHGDIEPVDLTELARFMLSFGSVYPMRDLENHVRGLAGFPERPGAETHPLPPAIQRGGGGGGGGFGAHGGGSGMGLDPLAATSAGQAGLPDLDRDLMPASLTLSMDGEGSGAEGETVTLVPFSGTMALPKPRKRRPKRTRTREPKP